MSAIQRIDRKWVKEGKRVFSKYPGILRIGVLGGEENWLELLQFYREDLEWLLSLEHHKFWSYMIYSEKAHELIISFLKETPPNYMKTYFLVEEDMRNAFLEVERLVFLVFFRLSTEKESETCYIRNFREVIYNNYLFTVPVILDICLLFGASNGELVKKMINNVITLAPDFLDDFQEIIPYFVDMLKAIKEKVTLKNINKEANECVTELNLSQVQYLVFYVYDSIATIQIFFELFPMVCQLFSKAELVTEIVNFYTNVLPELLNCWNEKCKNTDKSLLIFNLIESIRIDILKMVKSILNFVLNEKIDVPTRNDETTDEYLGLIMKVVSEPSFFIDFNTIYPVEVEVHSAVKNCQKVDSVKVNHIFEAVSSATKRNKGDVETNLILDDFVDTNVKLNSLVTEVKDIFPHLEDTFIKKCLRFYNNNTEKVIAAILENCLPLELCESEGTSSPETKLVFKGKYRNKNKNLQEMLDDKEEIYKMKERYAQFFFVADEMYDDEYDDTYDENLDVIVKEGDERRSQEESDEEEEEEEEEDEESGISEVARRDLFVENPAALRERMVRNKLERGVRDAVGRDRGQGLSKQASKSRKFKEFHKSSVANHNRKKLATRKTTRGMIPL